MGDGIGRGERKGKREEIGGERGGIEQAIQMGPEGSGEQVRR